MQEKLRPEDTHRRCFISDVDVEVAGEASEGYTRETGVGEGWGGGRGGWSPQR